MSRSSDSRVNKSNRPIPTEEEPLIDPQKKKASNTPTYHSFRRLSAFINRNERPTNPTSRVQYPPCFSSSDEEDPSALLVQSPETGLLVPPHSSASASASAPALAPASSGVTVSRAILIAMSIGVLVFFQAANISLLTTTQGVIAGDLDAYESTTWFTSAYLLAGSSLSPVAAKLSSIFPATFCLLVTSLILAFGSAITSWSPSLAVFLSGRVITGVGGAGVLMFAQVLIQLTSDKRRGLAQGALNTGYTCGIATGAILAGVIEPRLGWRSLFWLQIPWLVAAGIVLFFAVPSHITGRPSQETSSETTIANKLGNVDYVGGVLLVLAIVTLLYGFASPSFDTLSIVLISLSVLVLLPCFIFQELHHPDAILPIKVLKSRGILLSCVATLGYMMSRWSVLFYTPVYATAVRGFPPAEAGSLLVPTNFGFAAGNLLSGALHIRRAGSFYTACLVIYAIFPLTLLAIASLSTESVPMWLYWVLLLWNGMTAGAGVNYTLAHILHLSPNGTKITVLSLFYTFRGFAGTFGATIGGGIFSRALRSALARRFSEKGLKAHPGLLRELMGSPRAVQELHGSLKEAAIEGYIDALRALFLSSVGLALLTLTLQALTGWKKPEDEAPTPSLTYATTPSSSGLDSDSSAGSVGDQVLSSVEGTARSLSPVSPFFVFDHSPRALEEIQKRRNQHRATESSVDDSKTRQPSVGVK